MLPCGCDTLDPIVGHQCDLEPRSDGKPGVQEREPKEGDRQQFWLLDPSTFEVRPIMMERVGVSYVWQAVDGEDRRRYIYEDIFESEEKARSVAFNLKSARGL